MIKHFEHGGCGVRPFLNLWLLNHCGNFSYTDRETLLKQGGFLPFANACEKLSVVWLENAQYDVLEKQLEEYILTGGVYGSLQNRVSMQQAKKGGKFKYILSRIFISNKELKIKYPKLEKYPWLAPFYHIKRWLKPLTNKDSGKRSFNELSETSTVEEREKQAREILLRNLGLK